MVEPSDITPLSPRVSDVSSESAYLREEDYLESPASEVSQWTEGEKRGWTAKVRHAVGITLLLATVFLWTASNFLASVRTSLVSDGMVGEVLVCIEAHVQTDHLRRRLLLQTLFGYLRQHILLHPSTYPYVSPPPMGRPVPSKQRSPTPPTPPSACPRPLATASGKMDTTPRSRVPLIHLVQEQGAK
jgi:hypothetical protein